MCCGLAVCGGQRAMLGGLCALLGGASAPFGGADDDVSTGNRVNVAFPRAGGVTLCRGQIASGGRLVARQRREITRVRSRIAFAGGVQTRLGGLVAATGALFALKGVVLTDVTSELVRPCVNATSEVAIAGSLIAFGSKPIAVSACLIAVGARLIGF